MVEHTVLEAQQRITQSLPSLQQCDGSSFQGFVPPSDMVISKSVVGIKPSDSGVMICYWVDACNYTWLAEH